MQPKIIYRRLDKSEFARLRGLFGDDPRGLWPKYERQRVAQMDAGLADIYVAEIDGEIVGEIAAVYRSRKLPGEALLGQRAYFEAFRVEYGLRGLGLGQELLSFAIADLETRGYTEFTVGVADDNPVAQHIYQKFGFTEVVARGQGDEFDPSVYTLYLRPASASIPVAVPFDASRLRAAEADAVPTVDSARTPFIAQPVPEATASSVSEATVQPAVPPVPDDSPKHFSPDEVVDIIRDMV